MRKLLDIALLFLFALSLYFPNTILAQQEPNSLLGTMLNEMTRQGAQPPEHPYYGYDPRNPDDYYDDRYYDVGQGKRITCESRGDRYNYCRTNIRGRVRLDRQLSDAPCRRYETWGADGDGSGVWVSDGCRATFLVEPRKARSRYEEKKGGNKGRTITCESKRDRYNYCRTNAYGEVYLDRQLSEAPCREYETWGADGDGGGIWVRDGCRGVFVVESRRSWHGRGNRPDNKHQKTRTFTCKSDGFKYNHCQTGTRGGTIKLVRQISDAPCREHYTWGADRDGGGVWVDKGCVAEFVVD